MKKAYFSKRIYKIDVPHEMVDALAEIIEIFNQAKRFAFQTIVREQRWNRKLYRDSLHLVLKRKYQLNDYYANSAAQEAKALFTGLMVLQKRYEKQTQEKLKKLKKKLKQERTKLTNLRKIKQSCVKGTLTFPKKNHFAKHNNLISLSRKKDTLIWLSEYLFERQYLDVQIKRIQAKNGVIGVDCNLEHFAWANVTKDGNYKGSGSLRFSIMGKSTGQITKIIEVEVSRLVDLAERYNKAIVLEKLDTTQSKTGDRYGNKRANRMKSMFAYEKMTSAILNRADKRGVAVFQVNPAYTSISGKMKYMRKFGISIHQSAAFMIGRRGLGYKEKVPRVLQPDIPKKDAHHWSHWHQLNNQLDIRTHHFYQLYDVDQPKEALQIERLHLFEHEKKKLAKRFV